MIKIQKNLLPISIVSLGAFSILNIIANKKRLKRLEEKVQVTKNDMKSILSYQEQKNLSLEKEIEDIRDEVASCYEHLEVFSNKDGR